MEVVCVGQLTKLIGNFATAPKKTEKRIMKNTQVNVKKSF